MPDRFKGMAMLGEDLSPKIREKILTKYFECLYLKKNFALSEEIITKISDISFTFVNVVEKVHTGELNSIT